MREHILAVQRMQDYIEANLCERITIDELARVSSFSPWYARRLFLKWTGHSPSHYIRKLRLRTSALRLRDEYCRVIDVALELGFGCVDGYQRAFIREFGCNPKEFAKHPVPLYLFTLFAVTSQYPERKYTTMNEVKHVFIQVIDKPKRKAIIKRGVNATDYFSYCEEVGCDVWGLLSSVKSSSKEAICMWLPKHLIKPNTSEYIQGVEVTIDYAGMIPEGFEVIDLPASKYLMFQGEPFAQENYDQAITELWEAAKKYDPTILCYQWDESNPRIQLEPLGSRGYIELLPIK